MENPITDQTDGINETQKSSPSFYSKLPSSLKRFSPKQLFAIIVITLTIPITVILVLQQQNLRKEASTRVQVSAAVAAKPNVVVIMTDDQDLASMAFMPKTNQLLKNQGTYFSNSFVSNPLCCPARATFLTGQYSHNNGVWTNEGTLGGYSKLDHSNTLAVWLNNAGYKTAHVGKYLNGYGIESPETEIPAGWDEWYTRIQTHPIDHYNYKINENGVVVQYTDDGSKSIHETDVISQMAVDFINRQATNSTEPFYLQLDHPAPHHDDSPNDGPLPPLRYENTFANEPLGTASKPSFNEADVSDKPSYISGLSLLSQSQITSITTRYRDRLESLQAVDDSVEAVINALSQTGKLDNTYIIFSSDNGWFQGEHRIERAKSHMYEESIKVPLIIRGPNVAVQTVDKFVANIDLAPTIVEWAQASAQKVMDGISLTTLITSPSAGFRETFLLEGPGKKYFGIRANNYVYVERKDGAIESYNLTTDPYQLTAGRNVIQQYRDQLNILKVCSGATCNLAAPTPTPTPTVAPTPDPNVSPTPTPTPVVGTQILLNPSFETDANNDGRPDVWTSSAKFLRSGVLALDGLYSGKFQISDNSGVTITQTVNNLTGGTTFNYSGFVNIPPISDTSFSITLDIVWKNSSGSNIGTSVIKTYTSATSGWNQANATLTSPSGTTKATVRLKVSSLNGAIYVDNVTLIKQ